MGVLVLVLAWRYLVTVPPKHLLCFTTSNWVCDDARTRRRDARASQSPPTWRTGAKRGMVQTDQDTHFH